MSEGVVSTVIFNLKPEVTELCVTTLRDMFSVTRTHKGFRNIRLLRSAHDPDQLILIQEWDKLEDHKNYMQFRNDSGELKQLLAMTTKPMQLDYWLLPVLASSEA